MSLFWSRFGNSWEPEGGERRKWLDLQPGDLIEMRRKIWRVHEVSAMPVVDWDETDREYFGHHARKISEEEWPMRPVYLILRRADGGKRRHVKMRPYAGAPLAYVLPAHYPVCSECGEPWPCPEIDIGREVRKQAAEMDRLAKILPGCCWHCGDPVTVRQKSITFEGENLLLPGAAPAVFHLRGGKPYCYPGAVEYERKWVAADPERHPTLHCTGNLIIHVDGPECSEDPFCPDPQVEHPSFANHRARASYVRGCLRCMDACAQQGIVVPDATA